ncbi:MAG TPA: ABC transporter permease [Gemmatimonadaceae bacterium]|nr:ABC transporter permease [Gemmatimonadaceae bacterium]
MERAFASRLRHDAVLAVTQLRRRPGFALVASLTLALGVAVTIAVFAAVDTVILRTLPFMEPERLMLVRRAQPGGKTPVEASYPEYRDLRDGTTAFSGLAAVPSTMQPAVRTDGQANEPLAVTGVSGNLFEVLGTRPLLGRTLTPDDDRRGAAPVIVLGYGMWERQFGAHRSALGQRVELNGTRFTVVGVMPRGFEYPRGSEAWIALVPAVDTLADDPHIAFLNIVGRVRSGVSIEGARQDAERLLARSVAVAGLSSSVTGVVQLTSVEAELRGDARRGMLMLLAGAVLVLLVACANVANLLLARAANRAGELSLRIALGASRGRLVSQLVVEAAVLGGLGSFLGLLACVAGRGVIVAMIPADLYGAATVEIDGRVAAFTIALMIATTLLFGVLPAVRGTRLDPGAALRASTGRIAGGWASRRTQRALVATEVAIAVILAIGGGVLLLSFMHLNSAPIGFDRVHTLTSEVYLPDAKYADPAKARAFFREAVTRVTALPGVRAAGGVLLRPLAGPDGFDYPLSVEGIDAEEQRRQPLVNYEAVTPGYFDAAGIPLLEGRSVSTSDDETAQKVVVISAATAQQFWPGESPIGKRLKWGPPTSRQPWVEVVGVVGAARYRDPRVESLDVYVPYTQSPWKLNHLVVRAAGDPRGLTASLRSALAELDPEARAVQVATVGDLAAVALRQPRFQMTLIGAFAALALLLGAVGIFGVVSFATARRTRELGVRMALGAQGGDVKRLVIGETLRTVAVGIAIGIAGAGVGVRVLRGLVYGVSAADRLTFIAVPLVVTAVAVLAAAIPAHRASRVDPIGVLRAD